MSQLILAKSGENLIFEDMYAFSILVHLQVSYNKLKK